MRFQAMRHAYVPSLPLGALVHRLATVQIPRPRPPSSPQRARCIYQNTHQSIHESPKRALGSVLVCLWHLVVLVVWARPIATIRHEDLTCSSLCVQIHRFSRELAHASLLCCHGLELTPCQNCSRRVIARLACQRETPDPLAHCCHAKQPCSAQSPRYSRSTLLYFERHSTKTLAAPTAGTQKCSLSSAPQLARTPPSSAALLVGPSQLLFGRSGLHTALRRSSRLHGGVCAPLCPALLLLLPHAPMPLSLQLKPFSSTISMPPQRGIFWHGNIRRQASAWAANRRASESEARQLAWADRDRARAMQCTHLARLQPSA
jgi:hypothetical protein